jgi:hypothetical protein
VEFAKSMGLTMLPVDDQTALMLVIAASWS